MSGITNFMSHLTDRAPPSASDDDSTSLAETSVVAAPSNQLTIGTKFTSYSALQSSLKRIQVESGMPASSQCRRSRKSFSDEEVNAIFGVAACVSGNRIIKRGNVYCNVSGCSYSIPWSYFKASGTFDIVKGSGHYLFNLSHSHTAESLRVSIDGREIISKMEDMTASELSEIEHLSRQIKSTPDIQVQLRDKFPGRAFCSDLVYRIRMREPDKKYRNRIAAGRRSAVAIGDSDEDGAPQPKRARLDRNALEWGAANASARDSMHVGGSKEDEAAETGRNDMDQSTERQHERQRDNRGETEDSAAVGSNSKSPASEGMAAAEESVPSEFRKWLCCLDANGRGAGRFEAYAAAFEKEFDSLEDVALTADHPRHGVEAILQTCGVRKLGDKVRIEWAIRRLPRPERASGVLIDTVAR